MSPKTYHVHKAAEGENAFWSNDFNFEWSLSLFKSGRAVLAALLGTVVEYYDYALYGYMASVFAGHFFPSTDPTTSVLKHFLVFSLGFITKPLGAYIFGTIGDTKGRKHALRYSIVGIALPTFIIGGLPSYAEWGILAPALVILCRMIQSTFISAEKDGVAIFIYETLSKKHACLANSFVGGVSSSLGGSIASFVCGVVLSPSMPSWAWRLPFFLGGILGLVTLWFRKYLVETYDYILYQRKRQLIHPPDSSFFQTIWSNRKSVFLSMLVLGSTAGTYYFYLVFWTTYLHKLLNKISASEACFKASFLGLLYVCSTPICGYIADRLTIPRALKVAYLLSCLMLTANGLMLHYQQQIPTWVLAGTTIALALFHVPARLFLLKLFDIKERYRCISTAHAFGSILLGSTAPAIATHIWATFHNPLLPIVYCTFLLLVGYFASLFVVPKAPDALETEEFEEEDEEDDFSEEILDTA